MSHGRRKCLKLANTNRTFCICEGTSFDMRPPGKIGHIAIGHGWRGSSIIWSTPVDSAHALTRARFCLHLVRGNSNTRATRPRELIPDDDRRLQFQLELLMWLSSQQNAQNPRKHWKKMKEALLLATTDTQDSVYT